MIVRTETFGPGEKDFVIQLRLNGPDKAPLPAGRYVAEGWLTTMVAKVFDGSVPFQVRGSIDSTPTGARHEERAP